MVMGSRRMTNSMLFGIAVALAVAACAGAGSVGVNYGRVADNLPSALKVVKLVTSQGIDRVKLYDTDPAVLRAFSGSGVKVTVALPNEQLVFVSRRLSNAYAWVKQNVAAYVPATQIAAVAVGNEVFVGAKNVTSYLVPAMNNIYKALVFYKLQGTVKVSSPLALSALQTSYPPSSGAFRSELTGSVMRPMLDFLNQTGSYLMVNVYPYFAYKDNVAVISLDYALFRPNAGVRDSASGLLYKNLFDAQLDAVFAAMAALGHKNLDIVVTETGWPSKGDEDETGASRNNAAAYNGNLVKHVISNSGTPMKPNASLDTYLFALFNENKKPGPTSERNFGLFYPTEAKVYDIALSAKEVKNSPPSAQAPASRPFFSGSTPVATQNTVPPAADASTAYSPSSSRGSATTPRRSFSIVVALIFVYLAL
uniref:glucan endo-1,3-beta-D-glucosidase n=1 Tax=Araucaria cunninghamii TaxID=56994 RepID=A0A0D6QW33_ARACU